MSEELEINVVVLNQLHYGGSLYFQELDVFVHRGIYEAANAMYDQVLPEVLAHIATHGDLARARFTGHSLGGSLATLLVLMFQIRGILSSTAILPVVTFGSPCIMCGGDYLLQKLKLPKNHIQSLMMHRDVVPRAFACDYPDHVAEVLKRLNGRFRDHPCLNNQVRVLIHIGYVFTSESPYFHTSKSQLDHKDYILNEL